MNLTNAITETRKTAEWLRALAKEHGEPQRDTFCAQKAEALLAVCAELERLESALPKTADGVTITPGMQLWTVSTTTHQPISLGRTQMCLDFIAYNIMSLYSSREAAEAGVT